MSKLSNVRARAKGKEDIVLPIIEDLETYASLDSLANSEGGKVLIKTLTDDVFATIDTLCITYKKASQAELQALCAVLQVNLDLLRAIRNAPKNKALARIALDEQLGE